MKIKFTTIFVVVLLFFCIVNAVFCQHIKQHTDRDEWEENIGLKFVTVTAKDDGHVYFYQIRKYERRIDSMAFDSDTRFDAGPKAYQFTGCFALHFCRKHQVLYVMQRTPCFDDEAPTRLSATRPK